MPGGARRARARCSRIRRWRKHAARCSPTSGRDAYYKGPIAEAIVRVLARRTAASSRSRTSPSHRSTWDEPISTNYRGYDGVGAAAATARARRAPDAEHPRGLRPEGHGPRVRRLLARDDRGQEDRLRRPRALLRRSGVREGAGRASCSPRTTREARAARSTCSAPP